MRKPGHGPPVATSPLWALALVIGCARAQGDEPPARGPVPPTPGTGGTRAHDSPDSGGTGSTATVRAEGPPGAAFAPTPEASTLTTVSMLAELMALPGSTSTSVGGPNDGEVRGAVALPLRAASFRFGPARDPSARFGTVEMVQALVGAAETVATTLPGGQLTVNDLGLEHGGAIPHHGSHRAGRDVDVLFYLLDAHGQPRPGIGVPIEPDGTGMDYRDLASAEDDVPVRLDVPRTWAFVEALLGNEHAVVQRIFVVEHVRTMLLEHARAHGADAARLRRFEDTTCQPSYAHDDHLHVRFFCTAEDIAAGCTDSSPIYPWHRAALLRQGVRPAAQVVRADRPRAEITTEEEARARAPAVMHPDVVAFLARRDAWKNQPHPGRRYCR